jgi:glutamyl-tRNA synthetase
LGWGLSADQDIFTLEEMAKAFDIQDVNPNPARFDIKKADAINATHIRSLEAKDFAERLVPYLQAGNVLSQPATTAELKILEKASPLIQERITVLSEAVGMLGFLFVDSSKITIEDDARKGLPENAKEIVSAAVAAISALDDFTTDALQAALNKVLVEDMGEKPKNAFGPLRTAISGRRVSPPLFESMEILGKAETLARLELFARS